MKLKGVLTVSAIYLALRGVGFMFAPRQIGVDAVPADASPALIAYLRIFGGPFLGIAVLNWMARNPELLRRVTPLSLPIQRPNTRLERSTAPGCPMDATIC
jgi:hypothetical protein